MELWQLMSIVIGITWFPVGYFGARLLNGFFPEEEFKWNAPVRTEAGRVMFGLGILLGWITLSILILLLLILFSSSLVSVIFLLLERIGTKFAPKQ